MVIKNKNIKFNKDVGDYLNDQIQSPNDRNDFDDEREDPTDINKRDREFVYENEFSDRAQVRSSYNATDKKHKIFSQ